MKLLAMAVVCLILFAQGAAADGMVAVVTAIRGSATHNSKVLRVSDTIYAGEEVHVGSGSQITLLFFRDDHKEAVDGDRYFKVSVTGTSGPAVRFGLDKESGLPLTSLYDWEDHDNRAAIAINVHGEVQRDGRPLTRWSELLIGERVSVSEAAWLTLRFYRDQHTEVIHGPVCFPTSSNGSGAPRESKQILRVMNSLEERGPVRYSINGQGDSYVVALWEGATMSNQPTLRWTARGCDYFIISLMKNFGEKPFLAETVSGTSFKVPLELDRGKSYLWSVQGRKGGNDVDCDVNYFTILGDPELASWSALRSNFEDSAARDPLGVQAYLDTADAYLRDGFSEEAIEVFESLVERHPVEAFSHDILSSLYQCRGCFGKRRYRASQSDGASQLG